MRLIGMNQVATVISNAMKLFGEDYSRDRSQRHSVLKEMDDAPLRFCDDEFFQLIRSEAGGFETAADAFADNLPTR